jgi:fatty acid synthase subunit beta, fungi type
METTTGPNSPPRMEQFFKKINARTMSYTYRHEAGLIYATEFAQPALTIMEQAIFEHLKSKGLMSESGVLFAGHSLGEYSALASIADIMPFDRLLSVVFYRGLTMQAAVERDQSGRSNFAMMAVNPSRVSKNFNTARLERLVQFITKQTGDLLEIVNYNVDGQQYVCAGTLNALECLATTCDFLAANSEAALEIHQNPQALENIATRCLAQVNGNPKPTVLKRGKATIPLDGIDVPFHSSFLFPKLPAFRNLLLKSIDVEDVDPGKLVGKYVPNVTAEPFELSREYFQKAWEITGSDRLRDILDRWDEPESV